MATGAGLGSLIPVAVSVVGIFTMLRARANRRAGKSSAADEDHERRTAAAVEMERRMASYLAQRDSGNAQGEPVGQNEQEIRR
jgi:hypothetical protein